MTLKVVEFKKELQPEPLHKEMMIEFLEDLLKEVRNNEVRGLFVGYTYTNEPGAIGGCRYGDQDLLLVGCIERLKHHLISGMT